MRLALVALLVVACTPSQRARVYVDVSAGGTQRPRETFASTGVSYPLGPVSVSAGVWVGPDVWGPYWGISYAWAPFAAAE